MSSIFDKQVPAGNNKVSSSAFLWLLSEMVQYSQTRVKSVDELETRLAELGVQVGLRMLELACFRDRQSRRAIRVIDVLEFVQGDLWTAVFSKPADELQKSTESDEEYMITEIAPVLNQYISAPKDMHFNICSFAAGVIKGVLDAAGFPAQVTSHSVGTEAEPCRTTFLIKFDQEVVTRDAKLERGEWQ
eukprot:TRINITY_DN30901_c0_g1_i2.p1 TRINITY_DN30901_c0_g1~~TRINITY_DN30901_c0_g1_i2.p1  ORF type:complete len:189 (+),score=46.76 TRINITY_DN30901_c0_g1_i2:177-743(+)